MHAKTLSFFIIFTLVISVIGCASPPLSDPAFEITNTPSLTLQSPTLPSRMPTPAPSETPGLELASMEGPLLLLQTDFDEYIYLNPKAQISIPFEPPISNPQVRLSANLSPSGKLMFFPSPDETGMIIDLRSGEVVHTYNFSGPALFIPKQAALEAGPLVTELELTEAGLVEAVTEAHRRSRQLLRWYQSDRYHLSVQDTGPASTGLVLDDHQTGTRLQLEDQPGFVEDYRIGPDGNHILLKKGLVFQPGAYRDKAYYLLNVADQTTQSIPLPEAVQNPSLTWFDANSLGLIHQAYMAGGAGYSLIDTHTMQTQQIIPSEFSDLRFLGGNLLAIQQDFEAETTAFSLFTPQGERLAGQTIDRLCFYQYGVANQAIIACELESFLLDQALNIEPFIESILKLSPAPNGSAYVMINRSEQSFLLAKNLELQGELFLEEPPLEIFWLPDSTGFLYRTHGKLFYFDLAQKTSHLLIESDLFSDYSNLNAVWVNLD